MDAIAGGIATVVLLLVALGFTILAALWCLCRGLQAWEWAADRWEWARPRAIGPRFSPSWGGPPAADPLMRVELTFDGWLAAATELTFQEWVELHSNILDELNKAIAGGRVPSLAPRDTPAPVSPAELALGTAPAPAAAEPKASRRRRP